jgi:hypothetical protein
MTTREDVRVAITAGVGPGHAGPATHESVLITEIVTEFIRLWRESRGQNTSRKINSKLMTGAKEALEVVRSRAGEEAFGKLKDAPAVVELSLAIAAKTEGFYGLHADVQCATGLANARAHWAANMDAVLSNAAPSDVVAMMKRNFAFRGTQLYESAHLPLDGRLLTTTSGNIDLTKYRYYGELTDIVKSTDEMLAMAVHTLDHTTSSQQYLNRLLKALGDRAPKAVGPMSKTTLTKEMSRRLQFGPAPAKAAKDVLYISMTDSLEKIYDHTLNVVRDYDKASGSQLVQLLPPDLATYIATIVKFRGR